MNVLPSTKTCKTARINKNWFFECCNLHKKWNGIRTRLIFEFKSSSINWLNGYRWFKKL